MPTSFQAQAASMCSPSGETILLHSSGRRWQALSLLISLLVNQSQLYTTPLLKGGLVVQAP